MEPRVENNFVALECKFQERPAVEYFQGAAPALVASSSLVLRGGKAAAQGIEAEKKGFVVSSGV